jgi:hypothetical protein
MLCTSRSVNPSIHPSINGGAGYGRKKKKNKKNQKSKIKGIYTIPETGGTASTFSTELLLLLLLSAGGAFSGRGVEAWLLDSGDDDP